MITQWLNSQEFYEMMYAYRWAGGAPGYKERETVDAFETVKSAIAQQVEDLEADAARLTRLYGKMEIAEKCIKACEGPQARPLEALVERKLPEDEA